MNTTTTPATQPKKYATDTTDAQWEILEVLIPAKTGRGRNRSVDPRRILDAIFYISRTGCQWRMLPHDFPPWGRVWYYFSKWSKDGTLDAVHDALADAVRAKEKPTERTTASVDSQTTDSAGAREDRAFDGGKKLDGRKRHIIVDSLGLVLALFVSAGNLADGVGGAACLDQLDPEDHPGVKTFFGDGAYKKCGFPDRVEGWSPGCKLNIIVREEKGWVKLPVRWVVERTWAWITRNRRLCRSYEHTSQSEKGFCRIALVHRMLRRLSPSPPQAPFKFKRKVA